MRRRESFAKQYRLFLLFDGCLCWWGSYVRRGDALRYLKETGPGKRVMLEYSHPVLGTLTGVTIKHNDEIRPATAFESELIQSLPVRFNR